MAAKLIVVAFWSLAPLAGAAEAHPVGKVINLLKTLKDKAIEEGRTEEAAFAKFSYWCSESTKELKKSIKEEKATMDELGSSIKGFKQGKKSLQDQIGELSGEIKGLQASAKGAKNKDGKRHKSYLETKNDLKNTVKSMGEAISKMQGASKTDSKLLQEGARSSVRDTLAFLAVKATDEEQIMLVDFVSGKPQKKPAQLAKGDEKKHVKNYSFKSDNVIELLKGLKLKFEDDYHELTKDETSSANGYSLEKEARDNAKKAASKSKKVKSGALADTKSSLAEAEGNLKDQQADFKADSSALAKTDDSCKTKTREWDERSKTRANEIEAIGQGITILAKVSGVRTKAPSNPVLPGAPLKFLQVVDPETRALNLLRATAKTAHSKALEQLALEVSTHLTGPFDKVGGMIQKMVFRLMAEQTDEDKHKAWCDLELQKTKKSMTDKQERIKGLKLSIASENAKVATITNDIGTADKMVSDIAAFMQESTEIRTAGKMENKLAIKDAKQAQTAIANAVAVLATFYKSSGQVKKGSWELVQKSSAPVKLPKDPKLWGSSYTGVADPKKQDTGVIAILEAIASDFSKMEAETKAQEVQDQKKYDDQMKASKIEKARREQESGAKLQQKKRKISKIGSMNAQKKHTGDELDAVQKYSKDLQPACVKGGSTYGDRKIARGKEIKALNGAKNLLREAFKKKSKKGASFLEMDA